MTGHEGFDPDFDDTLWTDGWLHVPIAQPPPGGVYYHLVRAHVPFTGSWGRDSGGQERPVPCAD